MNNAEYVKSLGLEFKDLTVKLECYRQPSNLYTWDILNEKMNVQIGSYTSLGKGDAPTIIGEWLLQQDAYAKNQSNKNKDSKAPLRYKLNKIAREFVNDTSISDEYLCKNQYIYFNNLKLYVDRVNKLLGKNLCHISHVASLNEERKEIYIMYNNKRFTLGSAFGETREVYYDKIYELVDKYMSKDSNVNKFVERGVSGIRHFINPDDEDINIYVEWPGKTYLLGSVDTSTDSDSMKKTIYYDRIEAFVNAYPEDTKNE